MFLAVGRRYLRSLFPLYTKNCARTCCMHYKLQTNKRKENSNTIMLLIFFIKEYWVFEDVLARVFFFRSPFLKCTHHSIPLLLFPQHLPWSKSFFLSFTWTDWKFDALTFRLQKCGPLRLAYSLMFHNCVYQFFLVSDRILAAFSRNNTNY